MFPGKQLRLCICNDQEKQNKYSIAARIPSGSSLGAIFRDIFSRKGMFERICVGESPPKANTHVDEDFGRCHAKPLRS